MISSIRSHTGDSEYIDDIFEFNLLGIKLFIKLSVRSSLHYPKLLIYYNNYKLFNGLYACNLLIASKQQILIYSHGLFKYEETN